ncbi:MAG: bacillithiol biosynthesis cysteine-adding enzyme BshC [Bacteroidetes bacterium]|nr:bacillithiol biosynthesis cysteine-adding enzyme BshC [Bacteroidota bacterium]MBU1115491.1 bacillithiol biosynthesis cysteine-adding enzyme BshC [Bacteroidota bacterium]MBU1798168.1 bacillithiol biosynthesis cysteine-adding enzyme BshC [Bacteroidota bacterium]
MFINYSELPGFQNLFLDYINEYENVEKFYPKNFRESEDFFKTFSELEKYDRPHQKEVSKIIREQYSNCNISKQTESNITSLASNKTFAVVTGQQVSLFGGPMYTIFKTISTIKLANLFNEKYSDYNFVPIFWMEADDHDFDEVASTNILDKNNNYISLNYNDGLEEEFNRGAAGNVVFNSNINNTIAELEEALRDNEFKNDILLLLKDCYKEGSTFKSAFKNLMFQLFDEYGLIIFDPQDNSVKNLLLPIFEKELNNFEVHTTTNILKSAELEEVYHAQIKVKPINLFYTDETGRHLIEPIDDEFRFKGKRKRLNKEELMNLLYFDPAAFSPNVMLRPVCQDFLLPTVVYVGGPSEISYFAQVIPNYDFFKVVSPILFPRASATIIEKRQLATINKFKLSLSDFTFDESVLIEKVIKQISEFNFDDLFSRTQMEIQNSLNELKENLLTVDESLSQPIEKTIERIEQTIGMLKVKSKSAEERKHQTVINQLQKVRNVIYPNNSLQERELNFIYFANKYGIDIIKWIMNEIKTNKIEHQILEV